MKRLAILTAAVLTLCSVWGCDTGGGERDTGQATDLQPAAPPPPELQPGPMSEADWEPYQTAEAEGEASGAETTTSDPSPISTEKELVAALKEKNPEFGGQVHVQTDGQTIGLVALGDPAVEDISPLSGLPLQVLELAGCRVEDISPLEGMSLRVLGLEGTGVRDISVLRGMPLMELSLSHTKVKDLSPLADAPLEKLYLVDTRVTDLGPLGGMQHLSSLWLNDTPVSDITPLKTVPLVSLTLAGTKVSDLSPLKGLPLRRLHIARSEVTDLSPLEWLELDRLVFTPGKIEKGIEHARNMRSLGQIGTSFGEEDEGRQTDVVPAALFWDQYDAGEFK